MKVLFILSAFLFAFTCPAQTVRDSIVIKDGWQKTDTLKNRQTLKQELNPGTEMIIISQPAENQKKKKKVRLYSSDSTQLDYGDDRSSHSELEIWGRKRYRKSRGYSSNGSYWSFSGHWCGFNFGFVNFANTDYSMYADPKDEFMDLDYSTSFVMQFNVFEQSINLVPSNNFGLVVGLGLEYQRLQFNDKHRSVRVGDGNKLEPWTIDPDWNVKRNTFKMLYLTVPLLLEFQFPTQYRSMYISAGIMGGLRLHSKTKIVYKTDGDKHKKKDSDGFNLIPVKADVVARVGYRSINVWGSYTLTNIFRSDKGPELHPYSIGLGISF